MLLFLYGSLRDPAVLAARAGTPGLRRGPPPPGAVARGWRRAALPGSRYPTLVRAPSAAAAGILARVSAPALGRLSAYEGPRYRLARLRVRVDGTPRPVRAAAWIAPGGMPRPA